MEIQYLNEVIPITIIHDLYNKKELSLIWQELKFLGTPAKLESNPENTGTAKDKDGKILKKNSCIFLDQLYEYRYISNILTVNRKILGNKEAFYDHPSWFFQTFPSMTNRDYSFVSYYEDGDYYEMHQDHAIMTCLTWFFKEPRRFEGGDLEIDLPNNSKYRIPLRNNTCVIFPSPIKHAVTPIKMDAKYKGKQMGRFTLTQFISISETKGDNPNDDSKVLEY